jgi:DnaD/phage-associated family protein
MGREAMTSYSWIKLYHEMLDDPKMGQLDDHLCWIAVRLFLIAGRTDRTGELPSERDMAWTLRISEAQVRTDLEALQVVDIVQWTGTVWMVTHFAERQAATSGAQRVSEFRKRQRANSEQLDDQNDNAAVTKRYNSCNDVTLQPVRESSSTSTLNINTKSVFLLYEQEIGTITKAIGEKLAEAEKEYPSDWFERAFQEAALHNARTWAYVSAILKRWKTEGFDTKRTKGGNGKQGEVFIDPATLSHKAAGPRKPEADPIRDNSDDGWHLIEGVNF